jgi:polygalacturonase
MKRILSSLALLSTIGYVQSVHNIIDHGAVHNKTDTDAAFLNSEAFLKAVKAANFSQVDREVYVPSGDNMHFTFMPVEIQNVNNITFTIDGTILVSTDNQNWPNYDGQDAVHDFIHITDSENIHI